MIFFCGRVCRHIWRYSGAATQNNQRIQHLTVMKKKAKKKQRNNNEIANFEGKMEKCHTYCRAACALQWRAQGNKKQLHLDILYRIFSSSSMISSHNFFGRTWIGRHEDMAKNTIPFSDMSSEECPPYVGFCMWHYVERLFFRQRKKTI